MDESVMKPAPFIMERYSPYAFAPQSIPEEQLRILFEAARWAPSSFNEQPWRFLYTTREHVKEFDLFLSILFETNRSWAKYASVVGLSMAKLNFTYNNRPNKFALYDTGQAMGMLLAQATFMGFKVHQMGGYSVEDALNKLQIPDGFEPAAMFVIGIPGNVETFSPEIRKLELRERSRKPLNHIVARGKFGLKK